MSKYESIETILEQALEIDDPQARAAYLDQACGEDEALRGEIESLLAAHCSADANFMDTLTDPGWSEIPGEKEGDSIGRYKLLQQIGEGGFGTVYMAEQTEPVKRKVALKVIKAGMDSKEVIARFEAERQALALMDHPNIAKVHDAGTTEGGRPYFVMELVKGVPLTHYCKDKNLDTKARLALFSDVCAAVQHAHQKGIIHRDLKPSNIMVSPHDGKPVVKVIDFGIAKAISMELTDKTVFTQLGRMMGTPQYMSPEQAELNALDIDTRSDIYSLGVVLYELLTGTTPLDGEQLRSAAYGEMQRLIREETPPKPSTRVSTISQGDPVSPTADRRALQGDLDWIVMKALEKERDRRYDTANGFAADIQRYLDQEPVSAGPPGIGYKMRKFVRRNQTAVAVATTMILLLVAGIFGTSWFAVSSYEAKEESLRSGEETKAALKDTKAALTLSRYEEAKAWLERARLYKSQKNDFAAAMMAAKGLGFRGFGAERQSEEFRQEHPVLLDRKTPEFAELMQIAKHGRGSSRPVWQSPISNAEDNSVKTLAFSPDGATLASCGGNAIKLWNVSTGIETRSLVGQKGWATCVSFSPDGTTLASCEGNSITLWNVSTGMEIRSLVEQKGDVNCVSFNPDGTSLASGGSHTIKLWNVSSGTEIQSFDMYGSAIKCLAYSGDGGLLAVGGAHGATIWDVFTGEETQSLVGEPNDTITSLAFSPDGSVLATGSYYTIVQLWDVTNGEKIQALEGHQGRVFSVAFSPDGSTLASGELDGPVRLWNLTSGKQVQSLGGAQDLLSPPAYYHIYGGRTAIGCVVFSPDGSTLAGGELDGRIRLWNVSSGKDIRSFMGHQGYVWDVAFSPDGGTLASGSQDRTSKLWEISSGKEIRALQGHHGEVGSVVFSPDGTILTSGSWDKTTKVWDVSTGSEIQSLEGLQDGLRAENSVGWATPFSPDGTTLATGSRDKTIKLWDVSTGKEIRSLTGHQGLVTDIAFSPDGAIMASGSEDKTIKLWDLSTGRETHSLEGHRGKVLRVVFSPDGAILASGSYGGEGTVKLWDVSTGKEIHSLEGYSGCESLAFSPDGMNIASREIANIVVYEVFTGKELYQLGHQGFVTCMNFSPDGTILASGSYDNTIKLWDTSTGKEIQSLEGHQGEVYSISFSPDGGTLASGSEDKTIKLWPIDTSPLDLASYLDPRNPWCRLEGSKIVLTAPSAAPDKGIEFKYTNVLPFSHVGILRSARSQEEKNRALFWSYLHAESWNSAGVLYARLTDPASKESAREMTVLKRAAKAQSASDRGLDHHAGWHLEEITPLLKPEETDPAMLKAKALIKRLNDELEKRKTSDGRKAEPK